MNEALTLTFAAAVPFLCLGLLLLLARLEDTLSDGLDGADPVKPAPTPALEVAPVVATVPASVTEPARGSIAAA